MSRYIAKYDPISLVAIEAIAVDTNMPLLNTAEDAIRQMSIPFVLYASRFSVKPMG